MQGAEVRSLLHVLQFLEELERSGEFEWTRMCGGQVDNALRRAVPPYLGQDRTARQQQLST
jgi:hypothetical protein